MPEMPEVETIRRDLQLAVLGKGIRTVKIWTSRLVKNPQKEFLSVLEKNRFEKISRRGKLLYFELAYGDKTLLIHLKMSGQLISELPGGLIVGEESGLPNKHTHVSIYFADSSVLHFNDIRTFGYLQLVGENELKKKLSGFGLEPLTPDFKPGEFGRLFESAGICVKALLLNQQKVAGIGNIYADEICHRARIRPDRASLSLDKHEIKRLFNSCQAILRDAIAKRGTTFSNYVDAKGNKGGYFKYLKVYNREGERCYRCGDDRIVKIRVAGRGTHLCENCQK